jgi:tetratricopeptide (TPR) repeat protein
MFFRAMEHLILTTFLLLGAISSIAQPQQAEEEAKKAEFRIVDGYLFDRAGNKREALRSYEEAAKHYQRATSSNPGQAELWKKLGFAYWLCNKKDEGLAAYKTALQLRPEDAEPHYMLGLIQSINLDTAVGEYREAVRLNPAEPKYRVSLGLALDQKKDVKAAIAEIEEAIRLNPENGEQHAILGRIWLAHGEIDKAIHEYRKALALRGTEADAERANQSLVHLMAMEKKNDYAGDFDYWVRKAQDWQTAIAQHKPGDRDIAAVTIGSWPIGDLEIIIGAIVELTGQRISRKHQIPSELRGCYPAYKKAIAGILGLTDEPNSILKKAALLHTDIAVLRLETGKDDVFNSMMSLTYDGLSVLANGGQHWEFTRLLLASIKPDPSKNEMVRRWYIATTAFMLSYRERASAGLNLKSALDIFPKDPELLFYAGVLHETYALPKSQNALPPPGMHFQFGSKKSELELAQLFLRKSVDLNPQFYEAHLRLGRVTGLLGNHKEAVAELQKAAAALKDPKLRYYASLFLGNEFMALGRKKEARECFERAAALYPSAQSPLFAESHLSGSSGDFQGALRGVQRIFSLHTDYAQQTDPWWEYDLTYGRDSATLIAEMRKQFGGLPQ